MYAIITENDGSKWSDSIGQLYHFSSKYLKYLEEGTKVIYFKGKIVESKYKDRRLLATPHYFGLAQVGVKHADPESKKNDYFCVIQNYISFCKGVPFMINREPFESVPESKISNYLKDAVRPISKDTYDRILSMADLCSNEGVSYNTSNDLLQSSDAAFESYLEGSKELRFSCFYERNQRLRQQAVIIHGYTCQCCGFNFQEIYGDHGAGYIHVHHIKPISEYSGKVLVDPKTDLVVLCANCHSMVHRNRNSTLSPEELRRIIRFNMKAKKK